MIRLLIADDERMEREALADIVMRRFEHEVTVEMAENGRKAWMPPARCWSSARSAR